ncbi:MAG TPA: hypothetical protein VI306_21085 [Pyrinomonadaceae bacterium]
MRLTVTNKSLLAAFGGFVTLVLMLSTCQTTSAQNSSIDSLAGTTKPRVTGVEGEIAIGKTITVEVEQLSTWAAAGHEPSQLVLFLNGREMKDLHPESMNGNKLLFHLLRTSDNSNVWESLLREPVVHRPVTLSVGMENKLPFDSIFESDHPLNLTVIRPRWGIVSLAVVLVGLFLLIYFARNTNMLRESGASPGPGKLKPYDEGRVQTASWFFLISSAYLSLWLVTGDLDTLKPPFLALVGINGGTALIAHLLDKPSDAAAVSSGFFRDILSNDGGYSFVNFQMLAWTLALGIIFVASVYDNLAMPNFNGALLALTGISSGTYLGFKFVEQQNRNGGVLSTQP